MRNGIRQRTSIFNSKLTFTILRRCILPFLVNIVGASYVMADTGNVMYRIDVKPRASYTRLTFKLEKEGNSFLSILSGKRLSITFPGTATLQPRKLMLFSDSRIEKISVRRRNGDSIVVVTMKGDTTGYRFIAPVQSNLVTLDVGPDLMTSAREPVMPGREKIWSGTGKLIREFEPPLRPDVPFITTDGKLLRKMLTEEDAKLFLRGEAAIYKEKPAEAEEIFRPFLNRETPIRTIASFRLGEALYMMQKYQEALSLFREGEKLCPEYKVLNPSAIFYFADCLAREGNFEAGRELMVRLIVGLSGTEHAPQMLVRLADMYRRAGREKEAISIYRNIESYFSGTRAFNSARMRMYDMDFFSVNSVTYRALASKYRNINGTASDLVLQDESLFKAALLDALYGQAGSAVAAVADYEKKYPYGIFNSVSRGMHEDLLVDLYHELRKNNDCPGLLEMIGSNRNYLAKCLAEGDFVGFISKCYTERGMTREEMTLFAQLVDSEWATATAPFMYSRIIEDAIALGDKSLAEGAARNFLHKFPRHELVWGVIARLGEICYRNGNMTETASVLSRIVEKGGRVEQPESLYYLGKARDRLHNPAGSEKAMALFSNELRKRGTDSPFLADSFMVRAVCRLTAGDEKGAMSMYRAGYATAGDGSRDAFLFKMGDLSRREGNYEAARSMWEKIVTDGSDLFWKKMASGELADLEWRTKWKFGRK